MLSLPKILLKAEATMAEATTAADIMAEAGIMGIMAEAITMEAIITADTMAVGTTTGTTAGVDGAGV